MRRNNLLETHRSLLRDNCIPHPYLFQIRETDQVKLAYRGASVKGVLTKLTQDRPQLEDDSLGLSLRHNELIEVNSDHDDRLI